MEAAEKQIMQVEYARSVREPPWDGYCGLVQTCDEECLSGSGFRWSSGSGNAAFGNSPKYNPFGTPGNSTRSSVSEPQQTSHEHPGAGGSTLHPRALFSPKHPAPPQQPAKPGTSPAQSRRPPRVVRPTGPLSQDAATVLLRLTDRLIAIRSDAEQQQGGATGDLIAQQAAITEEAYKASVACMGTHDITNADRLLCLALTACPVDRVKAQEKIKSLLARCRAAAS
ncbi:g6197 [Coccomyxa elongata]